MAKTETPAPVPTDVNVPAFDTPDCRLSPIVAEAMKNGATARGHDTDLQLIVVTFPDKAPADAFATAISDALK